MTFSDTCTAQAILGCTSPRTSKILGSSVSGFSRDKWDAVKEEIMFYGVLQKFKQNKELAAYLTSIRSSIFAEASHTDKKWRIELSIQETEQNGAAEWTDKNLLGNIITQVKSILVLKAEE